jgi:hypothetical protein
VALVESCTSILVFTFTCIEATWCSGSGVGDVWRLEHVRILGERHGLGAMIATVFVQETGVPGKTSTNVTSAPRIGLQVA